MKTKLLHFISLFLIMLVTGVFWGTWFTLTRSIESFSAAEFIHIGKVIISNVAVPMRIIMPLCILFMILSIWSYPNKKVPGYYFQATALILMIVTLLITLVILVPIDNEIKQWTAGTIPKNWETLRNKWQTFHLFRTLTSLLSFGCFSISMIS